MSSEFSQSATSKCTHLPPCVLAELHAAATGALMLVSECSERRQSEAGVRLMSMNDAQQVVAAAEERAAALAACNADRLGVLLHEQFRCTTHVGESLDRSDYIRRNTEGHGLALAAADKP